MRRFSFYISSALILFSCAGGNKSSVQKMIKSEDQYYSVFTEATKYALIGNYTAALQLYNLCTEEFPERAASFYQLSTIYARTGEMDLAKDRAKKAVDLDSTNKWYLLHLGDIYYSQGILDSTVWVYETVVNLSDEPEYLYRLAMLYSNSGKYEQSMACISKLDRELIESREVLVVRHKNYSGMNYQDSALAVLEDLIFLFPENIENYGMLVEYLNVINEAETSRQVYLNLLQREPENGLANLSFADFYFNQGKLDSALYYYKVGFASEDVDLQDKLGILYNYSIEERFQKEDSTFLISLIDLLKSEYSTDYRPYAFSADHCIKRKDYAGAARELKSALYLDGVNYVIWEQYLMICNYIEDHDAVSEVYADALNEYPNEINLFIYAGYSLFALERYKEIIHLEAQGLSIENKTIEQQVQFLNLLADSYREIGNIVKSDSLYESIIVIQPDNLWVRNNYGYYLSLRGEKLDLAEELSKYTIRMEPKNPTYLDTYGWILYKKGDAAEGLKYIESAIKNGAYNNSEVLEHYGDIMQSLNRCSEAVEAWTEALKYDKELYDRIAGKIETIKNSSCFEK